MHPRSWVPQPLQYYILILTSLTTYRCMLKFIAPYYQRWLVRMPIMIKRMVIPSNCLDGTTAICPPAISILVMACLHCWIILMICWINIMAQMMWMLEVFVSVLITFTAILSQFYCLPVSGADMYILHVKNLFTNIGGTKSWNYWRKLL